MEKEIEKQDKKLEENNLEKPKENLSMEKVGVIEVLGNGLVKPDLEEGDDNKEEIRQYPDEVASSETKDALLKSMKEADKIVKKTDGGASFQKANGKEKRQEMQEELQTNLGRTRMNEAMKERETNREEPENDIIK